MEGVWKTYGELLALRNINLEIGKGEFHVFLGPSGCGKTTLLRIIAGFDGPSQGRVLHEDQEVRSPCSQRGFIFQEGICFPWRKVAANISFGLEVKGIPRDERQKVVERFIRLVGLSGFSDRYPSQLSGGMRQKMILAAVLANEPDVLLMDEPFGALDAQTRSVMQRELLRIWGETGRTIIFVTHSIREALILANRVSLFKTRPGEIMETYDLDTLLGKANVDRHSGDVRLAEFEMEIYKRMEPFIREELEEGRRLREI